MSDDNPLGTAVRQLGWLTIPARIAPLDDLRVELAEIDENLVRTELSVLEQSEHLVRRSEILEVLGTRAQIGQGRPLKNGRSNLPLKTTANIASDIGLSERSAQHRLQIARNLSPEVREAIAEQVEQPPGLAWVSPLVQQVARLRTAGVYELLLFVYADGRRGLTVRNAKKPHRLERL